MLGAALLNVFGPFKMLRVLMLILAPRFSAYSAAKCSPSVSVALFHSSPFLAASHSSLVARAEPDEASL